MASATEEHLGKVRRRIARLEIMAQRDTANAKFRLQRYIDALHQDERSARASVREQAAAVDERLEELDNELQLAEHRVAAELAATEKEFTDALDAELLCWDTYLDRMQAKAATTAGAARERAEAAIADLRQRRISIGKSSTDVGAAAGEGGRDAKTRVLAEVDELKSKADASKHSLTRGGTGSVAEGSRR